MTDEWFDLVDEDGGVIGRATRAACHTDPALLHAVAHVFVFRPDGDLILQLRPPWKDIQPDRWDTSVGGHVASGETPEAAAHRELAEELGIRDARLTFRLRYLYRSDVESELVHTWTLVWDGPLAPDPHEVAAVRAWSPAAIAAALGTGVFTPMFEDEWARHRRGD